MDDSSNHRDSSNGVEDEEGRRFRLSTSREQITLPATINHARPRPARIPRTTSVSYPAFRAKQQCALRIGIQETFYGEVAKATGYREVEIGPTMLTLNTHKSQSKLSQQELAELQKTTHFNKKELQHWYKGQLVPRPLQSNLLHETD